VGLVETTWEATLQSVLIKEMREEEKENILEVKGYLVTRVLGLMWIEVYLDECGPVKGLERRQWAE
jgi:hypothetical protein